MLGDTRGVFHCAALERVYMYIYRRPFMHFRSRRLCAPREARRDKISRYKPTRGIYSRARWKVALFSGDDDERASTVAADPWIPIRETRWILSRYLYALRALLANVRFEWRANKKRWYVPHVESLPKKKKEVKLKIIGQILIFLLPLYLIYFSTCWYYCYYYYFFNNCKIAFWLWNKVYLYYNRESTTVYNWREIEEKLTSDLAITYTYMIGGAQTIQTHTPAWFRAKFKLNSALLD